MWHSEVVPAAACRRGCHFCSQQGIPLPAPGSASATLAVWALGLLDLCPLDYDLDGRMFVHKAAGAAGPGLEVSSLHEQAVTAFVQQGGFQRLPAHAACEFPHLRDWRRRSRQHGRQAGGSSLGVTPA
jgi:hypothetical protein